MTKHLWHAHGLALNKGKTRPAGRLVTDLQANYAATGNPESLDRVAELTGTGGLRKWMASDEAPAEEVAPLLAAAEDDGAGLCPGCFAEVPAAVTSLPPPLVLGKGRLAGDGYAVSVRGNAWLRTLAITTPQKPGSRGRRRLAPRLIATLAAAVVLVIAILIAPTRALTLAGLGVAALVYVGVRFAGSVRDQNEEALNIAWSQLAPRLVERETAARFLTRLCLVSLGRGDPETRVNVLAMIADRATAKAEESDAELQLLAAAWMLQVEDVARFGRDVIAGVATLAAMGFSGERPADFAEFVVGVYLSRERTPGDVARLRILLLAAAFDAGLVPRDLLDLWAGAPNLKRVMVVEPSHRLGLLFGLWRSREAKAWHSVGHGDTVFDIARRLPRTAAGLLERFPDLLLYHRPEREIESHLGPVLVCARGVAVGGYLTADPDADVRLLPGGRELIFGRHRIEVAERLPADFPKSLRKWLRFRVENLLPFIDGYLSPGAEEVAKRVLGPFCRRCIVCGTVSVIGCGAVGSPARQIMPRLIP